jgi:pimeloyl-ACP methyl ester carboxylesterase
MTHLRFATVQLATGPRLHYAEQGDVDGNPIVFLHGWPDSWFSFSRVLSLLPQQLHAFVPDQRGFGDSERPDAGYTIHDFAADAVAFLDALSIERATIVGHSFGSFIARCVALTHPERTARLILIGTGASADNAVLREVQATVRDIPDPVPVEFARDFQSSTVCSPVPEAFFEQIVAESLKLPTRLWREMLNGVVAYRDANELGRITAPTLLIWGERDALFPRQDQDYLAGAIPGARLQSYPDIGHCPNWESPDRVAADLQTFLQQTGS